MRVLVGNSFITDLVGDLETLVTESAIAIFKEGRRVVQPPIRPKGGRQTGVPSQNPELF
jgi:hypothetical protein